MLSQTSEYALRAMVCLAGTTGDLVTTGELARRAGVPSNYLAKVMQELTAAELLVGRRGVGGGYRLARAASTIRLIDVVRAVAPMDRAESHISKDEPALTRLDEFVRGLHDREVSALTKVTLADLIGATV